MMINFDVFLMRIVHTSHPKIYANNNNNNKRYLRKFNFLFLNLIIKNADIYQYLRHILFQVNHIGYVQISFVLFYIEFPVIFVPTMTN